MDCQGKKINKTPIADYGLSGFFVFWIGVKVC